VAADRRRLTADILVAGAGPAGLALALQAHDHGAVVRVVDRRLEAIRPSRALILHARTLEVLRPLGVTQALLGRADTAPAADLRLGARVVRVRFGDLPLPDTAFPYLTLVRQMDIERVLAEALASRGIEVERGTELATVRDEPGGVRAVLRTPAGSEEVRTGFAAGCDGPASTVRAQAGLGWTSRVYPVEVVLADAELDRALPGDAAQVVVGRGGLLFAFRLGERATWRLLATRPATPGRLEPGSFGPPGFRHRPAGPDGPGRSGRADHRPAVVLAGGGAAPAGQPVPAGPDVPGRGGGARLLPGRRPGDERGHSGRRQPGLEARVRVGQAR
jgi:2-polyprenyl-6-methoxyphenol hydroxylase-like FAD-dependent oxidoreductase